MTEPTRRRFRHATSAACLAAVVLAAPPLGARTPTYADLAPLLAERCVMCHSGPAAARGLRLDSRDALLAGSDRGPVVVSGNPAGSELVRRLKGESLPRMPMTGPPYLSVAEIARFEDWIAAGLPEGTPAAGAAAHRPAASRPAPGEPVTWLHVAPILATRCAKCHTDGGLMGAPPEGLRLTSHAETLASSERARVVPGEPEASELLRRIRGEALPRMPFDGPPWLDAEEERLIAEWIAQGARDASGAPARRPVGSRVRLHGRLADGWRLGLLELSVTAGTRLDKRPRAGDYVEVRGRVAEGAGIVAERIRRR